MESLLLDAVLVIAGCWAAYTDIKRRRISNRLTFGAAAVALVFRLSFLGLAGLLNGIEGWLVGVALLALPFVLGWMGAGDLKLLAAFGALGGPAFVIQAALIGCLAGGAFAMFYLIRDRKFGQTVRFLPVYLLHPLGSVTRRRMPFGPALAIGAVASMVLARGLL